MPAGWVLAAAAVVGAVGAIAQGQAAQQQAKFQSAMANRQAENERNIAAAREQDYRVATSRQMAARRAAMGASGVDSGTGSPLMVSEDMSGEAELQALRIRAGGEANASQLELQSKLYRMQGNAAETGSYFRAGASLLSGAGYGYAAYNKVPTARTRYDDLGPGG